MQFARAMCLAFPYVIASVAAFLCGSAHCVYVCICIVQHASVLHLPYVYIFFRRSLFVDCGLKFGFII